MNVNAKMGDLFRVTKLSYVRKDGLVFDEIDADASGRIPTSWVREAITLPVGSFCTFVSVDAEDPSYCIVRRDIVGAPVLIRASSIELVSRADEDAPGQSD